MGQEEARIRLQKALEKVETRIRKAEARPSLEEIEELRKQREQDLQEIRELRARLDAAIKVEQNG